MNSFRKGATFLFSMKSINLYIIFLKFGQFFYLSDFFFNINSRHPFLKMMKRCLLFVVNGNRYFSDWPYGIEE